ncbi:MAG: hypothetical protein KIS73_24645 [Enhydrobacter sp.]|nr:hypothetical protein [Enhydrobacter sp.]
MLVRLILFAAAMAAISPAARAEMPSYDVEAYCKNIAEVGGTPSQATRNGCLRMEQSAYDGLKKSWDTLPGEMRAYCNGIATVGGTGSYSTLSGCIRMEQDAKRKNDDFKFKR